jgi:hypothetical protein
LSSRFVPTFAQDFAHKFALVLLLSISCRFRSIWEREDWELLKNGNKTLPKLEQNFEKFELGFLNGIKANQHSRRCIIHPPTAGHNVTPARRRKVKPKRPKRPQEKFFFFFFFGSAPPVVTFFYPLLKFCNFFLTMSGRKDSGSSDSWVDVFDTNSTDLSQRDESEPFYTPGRYVFFFVGKSF